MRTQASCAPCSSPNVHWHERSRDRSPCRLLGRASSVPDWKTTVEASEEPNLHMKLSLWKLAPMTWRKRGGRGKGSVRSVKTTRDPPSESRKSASWCVP